MSERTPMQPVAGLTKGPAVSLAAVPPPPQRPARQPEQARPAVERSEEEKPAKAAVPVPVAKAAKTPAAAQPRSQDTGGTRDATFTTPVHLRDELRERARTTKDETVPSLVLRAVEDNLDQLEALVAREKHTASTDGRLFPDPAKAERGSGETRVPVSMRLSSGNLAVLDRLVITTKADNRSQLLTAALRAAFS